MKYIKLFEDITTLEVPNELEINDSVKDIFIELEDAGFHVQSSTYFNQLDEYTLYIGIEGRTTFQVSEVKDRIAMILDYMKLEWGTIKVEYTLEYIENGTEHGNAAVKDILSDDFVLGDYRKLSKINIRIYHHIEGLYRKPEKKNFITKLFSRFK